MTDVSIIIVNWNVAELLAACLDSIANNSGGLSIEVIVVDSASSDGSVNMLRQRYPWVTLLAQSENVGFTRGNNIGLAVAQGRHLLLLNPDTQIVGDMLQTMVAYLDANPEVGIVGPHTLNTDGTTQSSRRRFPTVGTAFFESTWLQALAPVGMMQRYYVTDAADNETLDVDWVQGHALLARRAVYEDIGALDPGYVMYFEEMDWCKRAKGAGWRVVYLGTAQVVHHGGKSTDQASARKHIYYNQSKIRYFRKHHGGGVAALLRAFLLLMFGWQLVVEAAKWGVRHKPDLRRQRVDIYWQVLQSGLKPSGSE